MMVWPCRDWVSPISVLGPAANDEVANVIRASAGIVNLRMTNSFSMNATAAEDCGRPGEVRRTRSSDAHFAAQC
jgi:hypothetical protein